MRSSSILLAATTGLVALSNVASAINLGVHGVRRGPGETLRARSRRSYIASAYGSDALMDAQDFVYNMNITLGGEEFSVLIDTGR